MEIHLPQELMDIIFSYIPDMSKLRLNKYYFKKYHHLVRSKIKNNQTEKYIRYMVRRNNYFIIDHLINENYDRWMQISNYRHKSHRFYDYVEFLLNYCIEYDSNECADKIRQCIKNKILNNQVLICYQHNILNNMK
jgi:hypothetical protein